jgi:hypothetical protein
VNWQAVFENIIANIVTGILAALFSFGVAIWILTRIRARRLRLLGISNHQEISTLPIYIAHLVVTKGGALLANGTPSMHFEGSAVPLREVDAARRIEEMLSPGILRFVPSELRAQLEKLSKGFIQLETNIAPAPLDVNQVKHLPKAILIGGPEFNSATEYFMKRAGMFVFLDPAQCNEPTVTVPNQAGGQDRITPDSPSYNLGVVERATFENGQVIVMLTGLGSNGTLAAVDWFTKHWDELERLVGTKDFGICLQCPKRQVDPNGYLHWSLRRVYPDGILADHRLFRFRGE